MQAGETLDSRYRLVRQLGSGGFGAVWEAFDERIRRPVAVKVITHGGGEDAQTAAARFGQEAILAGGLNNPHIVTIHDYGQAATSDGTMLYLVMELAAGRSLAAVLSDGLPPVERAVAWTRQILDALRDAHAAGVVHRDIKPENIVVDEQRDLLKVLDFGIATAQGSSHLTQAGMVIGSFRYMAPERCLGRPAVPASDLYSVGCLLHEMLTGTHPIAQQGAEAVTLLYMHVHEEPARPSAQRAEVPEALDRVVLALLAKEPEQRPADASAVLQLLDASVPPPAATAVTARLPIPPVDGTAPGGAPAPVPHQPTAVSKSLPAPSPSPGPAPPAGAAPGPSAGTTTPGTPPATAAGTAAGAVPGVAASDGAAANVAAPDTGGDAGASAAVPAVESAGPAPRSAGAPPTPSPGPAPSAAGAHAPPGGAKPGSTRQRLSARSGQAETVGRRGDAAGARDLCRTLVDEAETTLGYRHRTTLELRHQYARWTGEAGDPETARQLLVPLLDDCEKVFGADHYDTVSTRTALAEWTAKAAAD